jgi:hypothetical protein
MQTFLPYKDFRKSLECLDNKRLGKQRVEAMQILNTLRNNGGWRHHPIVKMWRGHENALKLYMNTAIDVWKTRGFKNTMKKARVGNVTLPKWIGSRNFHRSHKSNLLRKDEAFYSRYKWHVPNDLPYVWVDYSLKKGGF